MRWRAPTKTGKSGRSDLRRSGHQGREFEERKKSQTMRFFFCKKKDSFRAFLLQVGQEGSWKCWGLDAAQPISGRRVARHQQLGCWKSSGWAHSAALTHPTQPTPTLTHSQQHLAPALHEQPTTLHGNYFQCTLPPSVSPQLVSYLISILTFCH